MKFFNFLSLIFDSVSVSVSGFPIPCFSAGPDFDAWMVNKLELLESRRHWVSNESSRTAKWRQHQVTKECWTDRGIMENPGPHRQIMMDETPVKKWGLAKTEKTWRGMDLPRGHHFERGEWIGPVGGLPFPVTPHRSRLNRFWGMFQLKIKRRG